MEIIVEKQHSIQASFQQMEPKLEDVYTLSIENSHRLARLEKDYYQKVYLFYTSV